MTLFSVLIRPGVWLCALFSQRKLRGGGCRLWRLLGFLYSLQCTIFMFLLVTHSTAVASHPPLLFPSRVHVFRPLSWFLLLPLSTQLLPPFIGLYLPLANTPMSLCFCQLLVSKLRGVFSARHCRQALDPEWEGLCSSHRMLRNSSLTDSCILPQISHKQGKNPCWIKNPPWCLQPLRFPS